MIEREIDHIGRIVIPIEHRKELGIEFNSKVLISCKDGTITIRAKKEACALCGKKIEEERSVRLCEECIMKVKNL